MPAGLIPNEGLAVTLRELLGAVAPGVLPWQMMFWKNNIVPTVNTVLANLTESDWGNYSRLTLSRDGWTVPTVVAGCAHSTWGTEPTVWTVTGGPAQTPYGYAYVDVELGVIRFVQRFDDEDIEPIIVPGVVKVLPEYTLTSHECED